MHFTNTDRADVTVTEKLTGSCRNYRLAAVIQYELVWLEDGLVMSQ